MILRVFEGDTWTNHVLELLFVPLVLLESIDFQVQLLINISLNLLLELIPPSPIIIELSNPRIRLQLPVALSYDLSYAMKKLLLFFQSLRLHISQHLLFTKRINQFSFLVHKYLTMNLIQNELLYWLLIQTFVVICFENFIKSFIDSQNLLQLSIQLIGLCMFLTFLGLYISIIFVCFLQFAY